MIDPSLPCVLRDGTPVRFVCDDKHRIYPLSFEANGRLISVTRDGRYDLSGEHPLDVFPAGHVPAVAQLRLEL